MKKSYFVSLAFICILAVSLIIFTKATCDDDESTLDTLCNNDYFQYSELLENILSPTGIFYEYQNTTIALQPIISYLARQEKSPPEIS